MWCSQILSSKGHCIGVTVIDFTMSSTKTLIKVLTNYFNTSSLLVGMSNTFSVQKNNCAFQILLPNLEPFSVMSLYFLSVGDFTRKYFPKGWTYVKFEYINNECQVSENLLIHKDHFHLGISKGWLTLQVSNPKNSDLVGLGWTLRICSSHKFLWLWWF